MHIKEYLISIAAAAISTSCITRLSDSSKLVKVLSSIFVCLTIVHPLLELDLGRSLPDLQVFSQNADAIIAEAMSDAVSSQQDIIKQRSEAYICDKASSLGCEVKVSVSVSNTEPYPPQEIIIEGNISPYAQNKLSKIIETELGIDPEEQQWNR